MLVCGQEEPIQANDYMYQLDEVLWKGALSDVEDDRLNRYSFVWLGDRRDSGKAFSQLMTTILHKTQLPISWIGAYAPQSHGGVHAKLLAKKRAKEGWNIYSDEALSIAVKPAGNFIEESFRPADELQFSGLQDDELLLFLGTESSPVDLAHGPARPSMQWFAEHHKMYPSWQFLTWIATEQFTIAYRAQSHGDHPALVVVGTLRLPMADLVTEGLIQKVHIGKDAANVWGYPSS